MNTVTHHSKKVLIFFSSPNKNGNTKMLLDKFLSYLSSDTIYDTVNTYETNIKPCIDCKACFKGECPFNDDGMDEILNKINNADIIIVATPIYFNSVPSKFKAIIDRMQQLFVKKIILKKPVFRDNKVGILLTTSGSNDTMATQCLNSMFKMFFSCINANYIGYIAATNLDKQKDININEFYNNYETEILNILDKC